MKSLILGYLFLVLYSIPNYSQNKPFFKEVWYDKTPVSGDIRVGIIDKIDDVNINPNNENYYAYIADQKFTNGYLLCTVISSRDGRYKADIAHSLDNKEPYSLHSFSWDSQHKEELNKMKKSEITIISKVAETCDADPEYFTISQWEKGSLESVFVALNSEKKPHIQIKYANKPKDVCSCEKIEGEVNVNYNYICEIPTEKIKDAVEINVIQKVVRLSNVYSVPYKLHIKIPSNE